LPVVIGTPPIVQLTVSYLAVGRVSIQKKPSHLTMKTAVELPFVHDLAVLLINENLYSPGKTGGNYMKRKKEQKNVTHLIE